MDLQRPVTLPVFALCPICVHFENQASPIQMTPCTTAFECAAYGIQYALCVRRDIEKSENSDARLNRGFAEMPEVQETLDYHLNPENVSHFIRRLVPIDTR